MVECVCVCVCVCVKGWERDGKKEPKRAFWIKDKVSMETLGIRRKWKQFKRGLGVGTCSKRIEADFIRVNEFREKNSE